MPIWSSLNSYESTISDLPPPETFSVGAKLEFVGNKFKKKTNYEQPIKEQYQGYKSTRNFKPIYFNSNVKNEQQALWARVLKRRHVPTQLMEHFVRFVKLYLNDILPITRIQSDSIEEYIKNSNAAPSVKRAIVKAAIDLQQQGITVYTSLSQDALYAYTTRKSFVKVENLNYSSDGGVKQKAPRLIQGARPEFIAIVGPFFSAFQRYMKKMWDKDNYLYFTSGATNKTMGEFLDVNQHWWIFENDVSAWDASFSTELCKLEVWIAKKFGAPRAVLDLMLANIHTHGVTTNGWKYQCEGTRKSGDPFTSCFNSLFNALIHLFVFHLQTGVEVIDFPQFIRMMIMGDDNLMRHAGRKVNFFDDLIQLGFETESNYRDSYAETEFCSSIPVPSQEGTVFIPKPGKMVAKFGYFVQPPESVDSNDLLYGVCCGLEFLKFVPWYSSLLEGATESCMQGCNATKRSKQSRKRLNKGLRLFNVLPDHKYRLEQVHWCPMTSYTLMQRYGYDSYMFNTCSDALRKGDMSHPFVQTMFDRETDGVSVIYAR